MKFTFPLYFTHSARWLCLWWWKWNWIYSQPRERQRHECEERVRARRRILRGPLILSLTFSFQQLKLIFRTMVRGERVVFAKNFFWMCKSSDKRNTHGEGMVKGERDCIVVIHACDVRCVAKNFFSQLCTSLQPSVVIFLERVHFMQINWHIEWEYKGKLF